MTILNRIVREAAPLTGLVTAVIGLLQVFSITDFTGEETGAIMGVLGAIILFLRAYITPVSDPVLAEGATVRLAGGTGTGTVIKDV